MKLRVLVAKVEGRRCLRLEVSFGTLEPDPVLYFVFRSEMASCSVSPNVDTELGQAPTSQARPRDTDHLRPTKLAARTLHSVKHAASKFGHDPCPVRRGLVAAVKCCVKSTFFRCPGTEQAKPDPCVGFNTTTGKARFVFYFPVP